MLFRNYLPEEVLASSPADSFVTVMDAANSYKAELISKSTRAYNPVLLTDLNFLRKYLLEFGFENVPANFPKAVMDNLVLNAENIFELKGSYIGLELLLRALTNGEVLIDAQDFYPKSPFIILSDYEFGFLPDGDSLGAVPTDDFLYLFESYQAEQEGSLSILIKTPYFDMKVIKDYITSNLRQFLPMSNDNLAVSLVFEEGPFVSNPLMYPHFKL